MRQLTADYENYTRKILTLKKVEQLEEKLNTYRQMEETLKETLCMAQQTAEEVKAAGEKKAEIILREAEQRAEQMRLRVREEIQTELRNLAELKQQVELFKLQFKRFLQTLIEMADRQLDLDVVWDKMMELNRGETTRAGLEAAPAEETSAYAQD